MQQYCKDTYAHTLHRSVTDESSTLYRCSSMNVPGLRLLGRGEDGDSAADLFRDDCCPGIASSASSIIKFCTEHIQNVPTQNYTTSLQCVGNASQMHTQSHKQTACICDLCLCYRHQLMADIILISACNVQRG